MHTASSLYLIFLVRFSRGNLLTSRNRALRCLSILCYFMFHTDNIYQFIDLKVILVNNNNCLVRTI